VAPRLNGSSRSRHGLPVDIAVGSDVIGRPECAGLTADLDVGHDGILRWVLTVFTTSV
jgi:hypothetical protein